MNTLKDVMNKMTQEGVVFPRTETNQYRLSIQDCYKVADYLGVERYQEQGLDAFVSIFQNLKGGVGKSLGTNMIAEGMKLLPRYILSQIRVLIIDLDPQGTSTQQVLPGHEIADTDLTSILAMASPELTREELIEHGIKQTSIDGLDVLPCGTSDGFLADELDDPEVTHGMPFFNLLKARVINAIKQDYDFIFLDAGPHMDKVMKNCLAAANGVLVPIPPTFYNFDSTVRFIERLPDVIKEMADEGMDLNNLQYIGAYVSRDNKKQQHDQDIYEGAMAEMYEIFGHQHVIKHSLPAEEAYERSTESSATIFSIAQKDYTGSKDAYKRAYQKAQDWAQEVIEMMCYYHKQAEK